jgi:hypothetical protein
MSDQYRHVKPLVPATFKLAEIARNTGIEILRPNHVTFQILVRGERRAGPLASPDTLRLKVCNLCLIL